MAEGNTHNTHNMINVALNEVFLFFVKVCGLYVVYVTYLVDDYHEQVSLLLSTESNGTVFMI